MAKELERQSTTPGASRSFVHGISITCARVGHGLAKPDVHGPIIVAAAVAGVFTDVVSIGISTVGTEIGTGLIAPAVLIGVGKGVGAIIKTGRKDLESKRPALEE